MAMPAATMTTMPATSTGVSTLPTMSTMRTGRRVSSSTTAKNSSEKGRRPIWSPSKGAMDIS